MHTGKFYEEYATEHVADVCMGRALAAQALQAMTARVEEPFDPFLTPSQLVATGVESQSPDKHGSSSGASAASASIGRAPAPLAASGMPVRVTNPIVVVLVGSKGGSLKTSAAATLAHVYAERGYRSVLVCLDPQGSLTLRSGQQRVADPLAAPPVGLEYLVPDEQGAVDADGCPLRVPVPLEGSVTLYRGGRALEGASGTVVDAYLRRVIESATSVESADTSATASPTFVIVDCPPALGALTAAAARHASVIVVPTEATREGIDGVSDVIAMREHLGVRAPLRVLFTRVLGLTRELASWARHEIGRHEQAQRDAVGDAGSALKLRTEIPFTKAGAFAAAFEVPVTVSARADASSVAWRAAATEVVRDVLGISIRARKRRTRGAKSSHPKATSDASRAAAEVTA